MLLKSSDKFLEKKNSCKLTMSKINGIDTEWTLIQRQLGNLPPAEEEENDSFEVVDEKQQRMAYLQNASIGKIEAEMDKKNLDEEDEDFLEQLKKRRMEEMKQKLADQKYGRYLTIQASEFIKEVNEAGNGVYVIVHLYADGKDECQVLDECLQQLSLEHRYAKFVRVKGSLAIPNFPERNCPTILIYYEGTMKLQFTGLAAFGGLKHCSTKTIEWALAAAKVLKTTMKQPPKILASGSSTKMNFISKRSTRHNNDSDDEEDDDDEDY